MVNKLTIIKYSNNSLVYAFILVQKSINYTMLCLKLFFGIQDNYVCLGTDSYVDYWYKNDLIFSLCPYSSYWNYFFFIFFTILFKF